MIRQYPARILTPDCVCGDAFQTSRDSHRLVRQPDHTDRPEILCVALQEFLADRDALVFIHVGIHLVDPLLNLTHY